MRKIGLLLLAVTGISVGTLFSQSTGPKSEGSETVARPRKKDANGNPTAAPADEEQPKIPSKFGGKRDPKEPIEGPSFKSEATTVTVDVAVLDNKGNFIPKIPKGNFRILEDNVPQQITGFNMGEAPMTVCMLIEFSNRFQSFYSYGWMQTLQASYGFLDTLKPEDYVAVVAYDMRPEMLSDFSNDRSKAQEAMARLRIAGFSESNM